MLFSQILTGKVKSIGVSNFSESKLEEILPTAEVIPAVNQVCLQLKRKEWNCVSVIYAIIALQLELHVYNPQHTLIAYLKSKGIVPQAYSPLGSTNSPLIADQDVQQIATTHGLQPADVLLGYLSERSLFSTDHLAAHRSFILITLFVWCILVAKGIVVLPKSVTPARIASNFNGAITAATKLGAPDIEKLDSLAASGKQRRLVFF